MKGGVEDSGGGDGGGSGNDGDGHAIVGGCAGDEGDVGYW